MRKRQAVHPARASELESFSEREFLYATETASLLGIEAGEYRQLRNLLAVVRGVEEETLGSSWARYSLTDIAGLHIAIGLVGGAAAFAPGNRIKLVALRRACVALRAMGIKNPLIEVPMINHNGRIVARVEGLVVDPASGQALLGEMYDLMQDRVPFGKARKDAIQRLRSELAATRKLPSRLSIHDGALAELLAAQS